MDSCSHRWAYGSAVIAHEDGGAECAICKTQFVPASKLGEALERDRKGDEIIHELTIKLDALAKELAEEKEHSERQYRSSLQHMNQAMENGQAALEAKSRLDAIRELLKDDSVGEWKELMDLVNGPVVESQPHNPGEFRCEKCGRVHSFETDPRCERV